MSTYSLTLREEKGSKLTIQELDNNFRYLDSKESGGGGTSYYLYNENYDSATFIPSTVTGINAVSIGVGNDASGNYSIAIGGGNTSSGLASFTSGGKNTASGEYSTAMGNKTTASGDFSTSLNVNTLAEGDASTAMGYSTTAYSYVETALGVDNTSYTPISTTSFEPTDRLVVVGKGSNHDAFTILKNAKVGIDIDNFETTTSEAKLQVNGLVSTSIKTINSDTSLDETNTTSIILIDNTTNPVRIYLPAPVKMFYDGMSSRISIKSTTHVDVTTNKIQIFPSSSELIDAQTQYDFSVPYEAIELVTDGVNWWIISDKK